MIPILSIYSEECKNVSQLILHLEGAFYRAYERSAYLAVNVIKPFKPTKHHYKNIDQDIVSIGFPRESYGKYCGAYVSSSRSDGAVCVQIGAAVDESAFIEWKSSIPLAPSKEVSRSFSAERTQVYHDAYTLLIHIFQSVVNVQKDYKSVPGIDIRQTAIKMVREIMFSNDVREDAVRMEHITAAADCVEYVKLLLRILADTRQISTGAYMMMSGEAESVSSQLTGWKKYIDSHQSDLQQDIPQAGGHDSRRGSTDFSSPPS